ncbi:MAG TPA: HAMP domain-containing sensor histidine kinase [Methylomirabilota bacterium]|nr:HAMP domain-containing sensor histidine kinase [Methylomirabilota bacterium]
MSHELRTPPGVSVGYTDLIMEGEFGAVTQEERSILGRVRQSASALLALITAMLDVSRLDAGRLPVHGQEVRSPALFEELKMEARAICEQARPDVVWQVEDALLSLHTDRGKLKIILKNLLGNALKFTPQGRITVRAQRREAGVEVCVTDTGIGMPQDALTMIFEPFRQVAGEGGDTQQGTGLGLHIVQRLVALLGGTVAAESGCGCLAVRKPRRGLSRRSDAMLGVFSLAA